MGSLCGDDDGNVTVTKRWALISCTVALHGRCAFWYKRCDVWLHTKTSLKRTTTENVRGHQKHSLQ